MSYKVELRRDLGSFVATLGEDFNVQNEMKPLTQEAFRILEQSDRPLYYIAVIDRLAVSIDEVVEGTNAMVRGEYPIATHRNFKALLLVTGEKLIAFAGEGMRSEAFGNVWVEVFSKFEDAVAFVQSQK